MNADETVRELRNVQQKHENDHVFTGEIRISDMARDCAALIESLQAQLVDYHHMSRLVDGKMSENQRLRRINERLQAQLAELQTDYDILDAANTALHGAFEESRRRERAARNELCLKCGRYHDAHNGACDGCRWKEN